MPEHNIFVTEDRLVQAGAAEYNATFIFPTQVEEWVMVHNQSTYGIEVKAFDPSGQVMEGTLSYPDPNTIKISWYYPTDGYARLSS